uniref:UPF3 domain-containing protein n=1 Tax=Amphiprion ocellaris TaxID=80972 RepID=A0AAQ5XZC7_AMPOC
MKEDKENTRPKERKVEIKCEDGEKTERAKEKKEAMTKIVIRRLPPSLTKEDLEEQLQPLPEVDYLEFFSNDTSLYPHLFARAYINFKNQEDIVLFRDRFDGYVFIDNRGQEYPAIVEFAPFQKTAKKRSKKKDAKCGTIAEDPDYKKFLEFYNGDEEKFTSTPETLLEEIEAKSKELVAKKTTPLLDFLKNKQVNEFCGNTLWHSKHLLKKPDRCDDVDSEKPKEKPKRAEKPNKEDRSMGSADQKRRHNIENKEDRGRKGEDDSRKEFRERDHDRDREREKERRQKEKERIRRQDEDRRRRRERQDGENSNRRREDEAEKEKASEKKKGENMTDSPHSERHEKPPKDSKREESGKRERLRNKDRPAIQLYQPGARSRNRATGGGAESNSADRKPESETKKVAEKGDD